MRYRPIEESKRTRNNEKEKNEEQMTVKKGIKLLQARNNALKKLEYGKKKDNEPSQLKKFNSNLARLKAIKEEQRLREEEREKNRAEEEKPRFFYKEKKNERKPNVADDEFTVDCEVISIGADSKSTALSGEQKVPNIVEKKVAPKRSSQWASIMQNRRMEVEVSDEDESSFEDEFKNGKNGMGLDVGIPSRAKPLESDNDLSPLKSYEMKSPNSKSPDESPHSSFSEIIIDDISPGFVHNEIVTHNDILIDQIDDELSDKFEPPVAQITLPIKRILDDNIPPERYNQQENYIQ